MRQWAEKNRIATSLLRLKLQWSWAWNGGIRCVFEMWDPARSSPIVTSQHISLTLSARETSNEQGTKIFTQMPQELVLLFYIVLFDRLCSMRPAQATSNFDSRWIFSNLCLASRRRCHNESGSWYFLDFFFVFLCHTNIYLKKNYIYLISSDGISIRQCRLRWQKVWTAPGAAMTGALAHFCRSRVDATYERFSMEMLNSL